MFLLYLRFQVFIHCFNFGWFVCNCVGELICAFWSIRYRFVVPCLVLDWHLCVNQFSAFYRFVVEWLSTDCEVILACLSIHCESVATCLSTHRHFIVSCLLIRYFQSIPVQFTVKRFSRYRRLLTDCSLLHWCFLVNDCELFLSLYFVVGIVLGGLNWSALLNLLRIPLSSVCQLILANFPIVYLSFPVNLSANWLSRDCCLFLTLLQIHLLSDGGYLIDKPVSARCSNVVNWWHCL